VSAPLRLLALGGLGEFGANCLVVETPRDLVVVDAGLLFPGEDAFGIEAIAPDFGYVVERRSKLRGIVLTHAHEDHIGALPTLLARVRPPIWGSPFTLALARERLVERGIEEPIDLRPFPAGEPLRLGEISIRPIPVAHSVPHSLALAIGTPAGLLVHSGDFKIDRDPLDGTRTDLTRFEELGREGVLLLLADSTNADRPGRSGEEGSVRTGLGRMFDDAPGRVVLTTFSSHVARIATFAELAAKRGRKLALFGRSATTVVGIAERLGLTALPRGNRAPAGDLLHPVPPDAAVLLPGCQAEPGSGLVRAARGEIPSLRLSTGDRIAFSSRIIPGREKPVGRLVDSLLRQGCEVRDTGTDGDLHASGHAGADDLADLVRAVRPRNFLPIHGDLRRLRTHAELAREALPGLETFVVENGAILEADGRGGIAELPERGPTGRLVLVGEGPREAGIELIRDRVRLLANGVVFALVPLGKKGLAAPPAVAVRGLAGTGDDQLAAEARSALARELERTDHRGRSPAEWELLAARELKRWFRRERGLRPEIVAVALPL
jgi:ribonuclease J